VRLLRPDQCHDVGNLHNASGGCVDVRRTQLGRRQITAADDVRRQIAVAIVVVWKNRPFVAPVKWIVGGVEINRDLGRRRLMLCAFSGAGRLSMAAGRG
jgi:hypothetical protein